MRPPLDRLALIQALMKRRGLTRYLEIGVLNGRIFFRVKSTFKVGVDPEFAFSTARRIGKAFVNPYNLFNRYFHKTSDAFFAQDAAALFGGKSLQLVLIDGMHEFDFATRDVENALRFLADDGVILMHDCNPLSAEAACSFQEWKARGARHTGAWNGDVWKTIVHLRSSRDDLNVLVLDCDHGLGVVTRGRPEGKLGFSRADIARLAYDDLAAHRAEWLNLKPESYVQTLLG